MRHITLVIVFILLWSGLDAQDARFSQYYVAPQYFNPALAGTADGDYRISTIYRDQWRSPLEAPFRSFVITADTKFEMSYGKTYTPDIIGAGLVIFNDAVDFFDLNTNQISVVGSYHKSLSKKGDTYLGLGLMIGIIQKNINYDNLTFDDQFDQINGYTLATGEVLPPNNFGFADFSLGVNYATGTRNKFFIGGAYHHFFTPNVSFYEAVQNPNPNVTAINEYNEKLTLYVSGKYALTEDVNIHPRVLALMQGSDLEIELGSNVSFPLGYDQRFTVGLGLRGADSIDGIKPTAVIPMVAIRKGDFQIGLSYDANVQDLISDRAGLNSFEISMSYIGNYNNELNICPEF